jgi:CheY-like chemotaxis protein
VPLVLVADDKPNIIRILTAYLQREGFEVLTAGSGDVALELALTRMPDLVVLDLILPGLDGIEVCRQLRRRGDLPVLILTARSDDSDKLVGLAVGADDYVTKPFNPAEVVAPCPGHPPPYAGPGRPSAACRPARSRPAHARRDQGRPRARADRLLRGRRVGGAVPERFRPGLTRATRASQLIPRLEHPPAFAHLVTSSQQPVHGRDRAQVGSLVEKGGPDWAGAMSQKRSDLSTSMTASSSGRLRARGERDLGAGGPCRGGRRCR